jgi:hypothetical protein
MTENTDSSFGGKCFVDAFRRAEPSLPAEFHCRNAELIVAIVKPRILQSGLANRMPRFR